MRERHILPPEYISVLTRSSEVGMFDVARAVLMVISVLCPRTLKSLEASQEVSESIVMRDVFHFCLLCDLQTPQ